MPRRKNYPKWFSVRQPPDKPGKPGPPPPKTIEVVDESASVVIATAHEHCSQIIDVARITEALKHNKGGVLVLRASITDLYDDTVTATLEVQKHKTIPNDYYNTQKRNYDRACKVYEKRAKEYKERSKLYPGLLKKWKSEEREEKAEKDRTLYLKLKEKFEPKE